MNTGDVNNRSSETNVGTKDILETKSNVDVKDTKPKNHTSESRLPCTLSYILMNHSSKIDHQIKKCNRRLSPG